MFTDIIGQDQAKNRLTYLSKVASKTNKSGNLANQIQPIMLVAQKGAGKTSIAKAFVDSVKCADGERRFSLDINGAELKTITDFIGLVLRPMSEQESAVCFIDEIHELGKSIQTRLLSVFNVEDEPIRIFSFQGEEFTIDLRRHCFIGATTNAEKILPPLLERFSHVNLKFYKDAEIESILKHKVEKLKIEACPKVVKMMALESRQSPREAMKLVQELSTLFSLLEKKVTLKAWESHCRSQGFLPLGLTEGELNALRVIVSHGEVALGVIASELSCSSASVKDVYEPYLLNRKLIRKDSKRIATAQGRKVLAFVEKKLL